MIFHAGLITESKPVLFNIVFEDEAGNLGIIVDNTTDSSFVGIDTTNPELLDVSIVSNNLDNTTARKDDQVTLSFKTTEPIQTPTDSDISITGLDTLEFNKIDTEGKQWEVSGTVLASQNGNASFSIEVLDLAGNKGSPVTATDDNTQVVLDTTTPTLSGITLVSTNANDSQAFAKPGDNITLSFNSSEPIQIPSITLADNDSLIVHDTSSDQDGTSWKVVYTVTAGEAERDTTFSIDFKDIAGNEGESKDQTDVTNTIKIDTSIPTLSQVDLISNNSDTTLAKADNTLTLTFTSSESLINPVVNIAGETQTLYGKDLLDITATRCRQGMMQAPSEMEGSCVMAGCKQRRQFEQYHLSSYGESVTEWKDLSGNGNNASHKGLNTLSWSGNKIELDGTNYFYVENADELALGNTNSKKYHFFIVYKSTGQIDPSYGSTMLFGNYETNYTTGTKRNGGYPNMFYGINVYDENNSYASTPGNGFIRFGGRDDEGDFQGVWEPTVIEADNQFHIISAGESNANNKMYVVLDGNIQSITRNLYCNQS